MKEEDNELRNKIIKTIIVGCLIVGLSALLIYWYFFRTHT